MDKESLEQAQSLSRIYTQEELEILSKNPQMMNMVRKMAMSMYVTGLPNQGGVVAFASRLFAENKLDQYDAFYMNLRGFGLINSRFGQMEGDKIIVRYADALREFVHEDELLGHLGGDNFFAMIRKERLSEFLIHISAVNTYGRIAGEEIPIVITARTGVYRMDGPQKNPGQVLAMSSIALQYAKEQKKSVVFLTREIAEKIQRAKQIEDCFAGALSREEFLPYYQPKVNTENNHLIGAEALVRWNRPEGIITPGEFIPVLEQNGEIASLDLYILKRVCADIRRWTDSGVKPVTVSVNVSRKDLSDDCMAEKIIRIVAASGIERHLLRVEVTETSSEEEHSKMLAFLGSLRDAGITTAIDDFGTGYSSLNTLRDFGADVIKIDKSFIDKREMTKEDIIVLHGIINLAAELKIDVITEGVERPDQLKMLSDLGCHKVQGFIFDRPMPAVDFENRLNHPVYEKKISKSTAGSGGAIIKPAAATAV